MTNSGSLPKVIFGTSALGNLFTSLDDSVKLAIVKECSDHSVGPVVFDSAGKYGAGLALESLGKCLKQLNVEPADVLISNKLGWYRIDLKTPEPTFEPGVWKDLKYDAVQKISYEGILECFEQGNQLLNGYIPKFLSVHDPDEYLATARDAQHELQLYNDILEAYKALQSLKEKYDIKIGVGAKSWRSIERISKDVQLDWVMFANSMTIKSHPEELLAFMEDLHAGGVQIINSAVFHAGFLTGGDYYDYRLVLADNPVDKELLLWRDRFFAICNEFSVKPAEACVQFALSAPGVESIALNTSNPGRVKGNVDLANAAIPAEFWNAMKNAGLISANYRYL